MAIFRRRGSGWHVKAKFVTAVTLCASSQRKGARVLVRELSRSSDGYCVVSGTSTTYASWSVYERLNSVRPSLTSTNLSQVFISRALSGGYSFELEHSSRT